MTLHEVVETITHFAREYEAWLLPLVLLMALVESMALISLLFPGTVILLALGALSGDVHYPFWLIWSAGALGAYLGMWLSYNFGHKHQGNVGNMWPFSKRVTLLPRVEKFFKKWGLWAVLGSRFFAPFRATIPMIAGICAIPKVKFQLVNLFSAIAWSFIVLAPGGLGMSQLLKYIH